MAQVGIVMGSDSDMPVMAKAADILEELGVSYEMTIISAHREPDVFFDYCRRRDGGASAGNVRGNFSDARYRYPNAHRVAWRTRFALFHCADALRDSGGNGGNQRRRKCRAACGKNSCDVGQRSFGEAQSVFKALKGAGAGEGREIAGARLSGIFEKINANRK